ncbi:hypothetical protein NESM_000884800 [Novymonas esmeraldas]|uniref:Uncharacterized protein n=1 Tax=Novymonas esmeraldas TaxID=1808958 RepID=A0AAW0EXR3_9TRYP
MPAAPAAACGVRATTASVARRTPSSMTTPPLALLAASDGSEAASSPSADLCRGSWRGTSDAVRLRMHCAAITLASPSAMWSRASMAEAVHGRGAESGRRRRHCGRWSTGACVGAAAAAAASAVSSLPPLLPRPEREESHGDVYMKLADRGRA